MSGNWELHKLWSCAAPSTVITSIAGHLNYPTTIFSQSLNVSTSRCNLSKLTDNQEQVVMDSTSFIFQNIQGNVSLMQDHNCKFERLAFESEFSCGRAGSILMVAGLSYMQIIASRSYISVTEYCVHTEKTIFPFPFTLNGI